MNEPLVTILTPAYNVENYITACIESVLNQTYGNFEWILIDNGSTDNTRNIIREYAKKDKRIKSVRFKRNTDGFAQDMIANFGRGDYVAKLDSDDFWDSRYLETLVNAMESNEADLVCCRAIVLDEEKNEQYYHGFRKYEGVVTSENLIELYDEIEIDMNTYWAKLMRRDLFIKARDKYMDLYSEKIKVGYCGDTTFMFCYMNECSKSVFLMDTLYFYRLHKRNASKTVIDTNVVEDCLASFTLKKNFLVKSNAWSDKNADKVYKSFWGNLDTIFRNIVQNDTAGIRDRIESIGVMLTDERVFKIRREYCDAHIRAIMSTHLAWCYVNMQKECEGIFREMLKILEPEIFLEITEEQYQFLLTEQLLLALLIMGEKTEAQEHLEKMKIDERNILGSALVMKICGSNDEF